MAAQRRDFLFQVGLVDAGEGLGAFLGAPLAFVLQLDVAFQVVGGFVEFRDDAVVALDKGRHPLLPFIERYLHVGGP